MVGVRKPKHPVPQLTTYELRDYRRDLERALTSVTQDADMHELLRKRLAEVVGEQQSRAGRDYDLGHWADQLGHGH